MTAAGFPSTLRGTRRRSFVVGRIRAPSIWSARGDRFGVNLVAKAKAKHSQDLPATRSLVRTALESFEQFSFQMHRVRDRQRVHLLDNSQQAAHGKTCNAHLPVSMGTWRVNPEVKSSTMMMEEVIEALDERHEVDQQQLLISGVYMIYDAEARRTNVRATSSIGESAKLLWKSGSTVSTLMPLSVAIPSSKPLTALVGCLHACKNIRQ